MAKFVREERACQAPSEGWALSVTEKCGVVDIRRLLILQELFSRHVFLPAVDLVTSPDFINEHILAYIQVDI